MAAGQLGLHPLWLIALFHADEGVDSTLEQIFGSRMWTDVDMAADDGGTRRFSRKNLRRLLSFGRDFRQPEPAVAVANVCIRMRRLHRGDLPADRRQFLQHVYMNSRQHCLRVVVLFPPEVDPASLHPLCALNADCVLLRKRGRLHGWDPRLLAAARIPEDRVGASTCDLVGVTDRGAFVELRFEDEAEARKRARGRCARIAEELMRVMWHPDRVRRRLALDDVFADAM